MVISLTQCSLSGCSHPSLPTPQACLCYIIHPGCVCHTSWVCLPHILVSLHPALVQGLKYLFFNTANSDSDCIKQPFLKLLWEMSVPWRCTCHLNRKLQIFTSLLVVHRAQFSFLGSMQLSCRLKWVERGKVFCLCPGDVPATSTGSYKFLHHCW